MRSNELENFKSILLDRKQAILDNNLIHKQTMEYTKNSNINEADLAAAHTRNMLDSSISKRHYLELEHIERALEKIDEGIYGICEMCDEAIGIGRLKAKPHAKYCIVCRQIVEKDSKDQK
ncbi:RNA polymerase-binding protein DksA [Helicobacter sp. MIT 05-5294]|uniref:RNA polymerase-binding protein DksA n=1 Tax=Helicobacter sp. MIT 05-5294 TaxID=1548150 RepID=UPI00051F93B9|nr:RNA polymerase-binding protein DksA [Helicobacter sp. MIT 05-5294]TLD88700.1 RNA polymerase-binding protein DksA [Helicobacter sp. MIT 05-5294]